MTQHPDWNRTPVGVNGSDWHRNDWGPPSMPATQPRYQVSYRKMGWIAGTFHGLMMFFTLGLWTPVYLMARRGRKTVIKVR